MKSTTLLLSLVLSSVSASYRFTAYSDLNCGAQSTAINYDTVNQCKNIGTRFVSAVFGNSGKFELYLETNCGGRPIKTFIKPKEKDNCISTDESLSYYSFKWIGS
ncbi:hypothetical protein BB559_001105 [Furculomyces boomerangus]|uniref:Uncharacterized protein n=2 Tax=Harpellales TaxID=61421 RepID=A0A2T9Z315_9FUNG|nr:hypothetical protein BB559_001105 [Furculomyces boomerangus]PVZ96598.1 hypothetical protein BB558_007480 [Smittium angustum]PVZ96694.1 hypothetical protein BB558_007385 [Smittium angustum]PVZ98667.1 hypothetical protein BB558_005328 [Smittium angustum]